MPISTYSVTMPTLREVARGSIGADPGRRMMRPMAPNTASPIPLIAQNRANTPRRSMRTGHKMSIAKRHTAPSSSLACARSSRRIM